MLSKSGGGKKRKSPVLNHVLNSLTSGEMKIRGTDLAKAWRLLFDQRWHDILLTSSPCYGSRGKSALLRFNGFHLYRVGVTTSNIPEILAQKTCAICPPLGGFQMSEHQAISMAPTLRGGRNSDTNILINLSPCRPWATPLLLLQSALRMAVKIGFLCLCAISATVSPHNQLISKCLSSQKDSHSATGHPLERQLGDTREIIQKNYHPFWQNSRSQKQKNIFTVYLMREKRGIAHRDVFSSSVSRARAKVNNIPQILLEMSA